MASTEEERKQARLAGCSVEEWQRRGRLSANRHETAGGFVMSVCRGDRVVHMNGGADDDDTGGSTAAELCAQAQEHLNRFIKAPGAKNAHEHIARASAMCSAALSRCARDSAERSSAASMHSFRG
jgi:hypothetical protein